MSTVDLPIFFTFGSPLGMRFDRYSVRSVSSLPNPSDQAAPTKRTVDSRKGMVSLNIVEYALRIWPWNSVCRLDGIPASVARDTRYSPDPRAISARKFSYE